MCPSKFVPVIVCMIVFAFLTAPLSPVAASLDANANKLGLHLRNGKSTFTAMASDELGCAFKSWTWLNASKEVCGAVIALLLYFIGHITNCSPIDSFVIWVFISNA